MHPITVQKYALGHVPLGHELDDLYEYIIDELATYENYSIFLRQLVLIDCCLLFDLALLCRYQLLRLSFICTYLTRPSARGAVSPTIMSIDVTG